MVSRFPLLISSTIFSSLFKVLTLISPSLCPPASTSTRIDSSNFLTSSSFVCISDFLLFCNCTALIPSPVISINIRVLKTSLEMKEVEPRMPNPGEFKSYRCGSHSCLPLLNPTRMKLGPFTKPLSFHKSMAPFTTSTASLRRRPRTRGAPSQIIDWDTALRYCCGTTSSELVTFIETTVAVNAKELGTPPTTVVSLKYRGIPYPLSMHSSTTV